MIADEPLTSRPVGRPTKYQPEFVEQASRPVGRPTKYQPEFVEQVYKLCLLGAVDLELASFFGICEKTLNIWKEIYPDFLQAMTDGKIKADAEVAYKLHGRAIGSEWEEEQAIKVKVGAHEEKVEIVTVKRVAPPDTSAAIMWLTNRQRGLWRNTQSLQQLDKNGDPADAGPLRVQIILVGEAPAQRVEQTASRTALRVTENVRAAVQFVG